MFKNNSRPASNFGGNGQPHAKRARLDDELQRRVRGLNEAFSSWAEGNLSGNLLAMWEDGVSDYLAHAKQLRAQQQCQGQLLTFGSGDCGQLGYGQDDLESIKPRVVETTKDKEVRALAVGGMHNAIVVGDGEVWTWGSEDDGVLGRPHNTTNLDVMLPCPVPALPKTVCMVSAGDCHTTALTLTGDLYFWGTYKDKDGRNWFRSDGSTMDVFKKTQISPILVQGLGAGKHGGVVQVASGSSHTLALCGDGKVFSWGIGEVGQLGRKVCPLKDANDVYQPALVAQQHLTPKLMEYEPTGSSSAVSEVTTARHVACGSYHSFIITAIRSHVHGCGLNQYSQLGFESAGADVSFEKRLRCVVSLDDKHVQTISAGEHFSVALSTKGQLYSFGRADQAQLGFTRSKRFDAGEFVSTPTPVEGVLKDKKVSMVSCGGSHTLAVTEEGEMYSWGFGTMEQLGNGTGEDEEMPFKLKSKQLKRGKVVAIGGGGQHSCVLLSTQ